MGTSTGTHNSKRELSKNFVENQETREFIDRVLKRTPEESVNIIPSDLAREIMTEKKLEILETVQEEDVTGIRDLARKVERDPSTVKKDLDKLWKYGLINYKEEGNRKKPVRTADKIVIEPF